MKRTMMLLLALAWVLGLPAINLPECLGYLRQNTPLAGNLQSVKEQRSFRQKSLQTVYYPSLTATADFGYNSEVTALNLGSGLPLNPPVPDQDRESIGLELRQILWDGGVNSLQQELNNLESKSKELEINTSLHNRELEAVSLYFQVLTLGEALDLTTLQLHTLTTRQTSVEAAFQNGIREKSDVQLVRYEILSLQDKINALETAKQGVIDKLSRLCGIDLNSQTEFSLPAIILPENAEFNRAELNKLDTLIELQQVNSRLAKRKSYPQIFARATAAYGKPGFDMFSTQWHDYYSVGLVCSWKFWDWGQSRQESSIANHEADIAKANRANLLISLQNELSGIEAELESAQVSIDNSAEKLELIQDIVAAFETKYEAGIITTTELLIQTNNLLSAKLELQSSQTRLSALQAKKLLVLGGKL